MDNISRQNVYIIGNFKIHLWTRSIKQRRRRRALRNKTKLRQNKNRQRNNITKSK